MAEVTRTIHVTVVTFDPAQGRLIPVPGARLLCEDSGVLWDPDLSDGNATTNAQGAADVAITFDDTEEDRLNPFFTITVPSGSRTVPAAAPAGRQFQLPDEWVTRHYVNRRIRRITDHTDPNRPLRLFVGMPAHLRVSWADFDPSSKRNPLALPHNTARVFLADYDTFLWIDFLNPDDTMTGKGFDPIAGRIIDGGTGDSYPYADEWPTVPYAKALSSGTPPPVAAAVPGAWTDPPGWPVGVLGGGSFTKSGRVAVDPHGFVFIVDGNQIGRFYPDGTLCETIPGPGVSVTLTDPQGIALDQYSNLFVADTGANRIVVFKPDWYDGGLGRYKDEPPVGTFGASTNQFNHPHGLAVITDPQVDGEDLLAVADTGNSRVQLFHVDRTGLGESHMTLRAQRTIIRLPFASTFGASGTGAGQFTEPVGIAADRQGRLFVCDRAAHRVSRWAPGTAGAPYQHQVDWQKSGGGNGSGPGEFDQPVDLAVDTAAGHVYVADSGNQRVQRLDAETGGHVADWVPAGFTPGSVAVDSRREVYVSNKAAPGVIRGTAFAPTGEPLPDASPPGLVGDAWTSAGDPKHMQKPGYVAYAPDGKLWVADTGNNRVLGFVRNQDGRLVASTAPAPTGLSRPLGIGTDPDGDLYIVDSGNDRVRRYTAALAHQADLGSSGSGDAQLRDPHGIAIVQRTEPLLYVADTGNNRVEILRRDGTFVGRLTEAHDHRPLSAPEDVAVDAAGNVYVAETGKGRIVQYDATNAFVREFKAPGLNPSIAGPAPCGISVDDEGKLLVTDRSHDTVYRLEPDGTVLAYWDLKALLRLQTGASDMFYEPDLARQVRFDEPARAVVDSRGLLAVADTGQDRVRLLRLFTRIEVNLFDLGEGLPDVSFRAVTKRDYTAELGLELNVGDVSIFDDSHDFIADPIDDFAEDEIVQRRVLSSSRSTNAAINVMRVAREVQAWYQHHTRRDESAHRWGSPDHGRTLDVDLTSDDHSYQFLDVNLGENGHNGRGSDAWNDWSIAHEMSHWVFFRALQPYPPFTLFGLLDLKADHARDELSTFNQTLTEAWPDLVALRWGSAFGSTDRLRGWSLTGGAAVILHERGDPASRRHPFGGADTGAPTFAEPNLAQRSEGYLANAFYQLYGALTDPGVLFADATSFWHRFNVNPTDDQADRFTSTLWRALRDFEADPPMDDLDRGSVVYLRQLLRRCRALPNGLREMAQSIMELNNVACPIVELREGTPAAPGSLLSATVNVTVGQAKTIVAKVTDIDGAPLRGYHLRFTVSNANRYAMPGGPGPVARHGRRPARGATIPATELHRATNADGLVGFTYTAPASAAGSTDRLRVAYQPDFDTDESFAPPGRGEDRETTLRRAYLNQLRGAAKTWPGAGTNFGAEISASVTFRIQGA